jgi:hypothetical protein
MSPFVSELLGKLVVLLALGVLSIPAFRTKRSAKLYRLTLAPLVGAVLWGLMIVHSAVNHF